MTGTKRDYTQYLQSTRKVDISGLLTQQAQHSAPRSNADASRLNQAAPSRYRPYHQEAAGFQSQAPAPAPTQAAPQQGYSSPYAAMSAHHSNSTAVGQGTQASPYATLSARHPSSTALGQGTQASPYAAMSARPSSSTVVGQGPQASPYAAMSAHHSSSTAVGQGTQASPYAAISAHHSSSTAVGQGTQASPYAAMSARHSISTAVGQGTQATLSARHSNSTAVGQGSQASPYAAHHPAFPIPAPAPNLVPNRLAPAPQQGALDIPAPPWADDDSYDAAWDSMPPPPESYASEGWDDLDPMPFAPGSHPAQPKPVAQPVAPQPITQTQAVTTLSEVKIAAPAVQVAAPAAQVAAPAAQVAASAAHSQVPSSAPVAARAPAASLAPKAQAPSQFQSAAQPQVAATVAVGTKAGAKVVASGYQRPDIQRNVKRAAAEAAPKSGFLKPTPACDDMPDFEAVLALPKLFYQELVAKFTQEGVADPAQAAREATTMHPEFAEMTAPAAAAAAAPAAQPEVRFNAQLLAATTQAAADGDNDGWHAAKSADDIELNGDFKGWPGALLYQGNFEERMRGLWAAQGLELVSIEDKQFQKLCVLKAGGYQFKLSAFYKDSGAISYVQSSAVGTKAILARNTLEDYVGFDIRNLPDLTTLTDEEKAQIKKEVRARSKRKKSKTLSERNANLKLTSAKTAAQVVNFGQVDVEALAAAGKGKLMTVTERVELVLKSFDPLFKVTQEEPKPYNFRFAVAKPEHYDFAVRVYHKKDETISSIFVQPSEAMEALPNSVECLMLLEQIKEALTQSLVGTSTKVLIKPRSAKVNDNHVLEVAYVQF